MDSFYPWFFAFFGEGGGGGRREEGEVINVAIKNPVGGSPVRTNCEKGHAVFAFSTL